MPMFLQTTLYTGSSVYFDKKQSPLFMRVSAYNTRTGKFRHATQSAA
jgi:hypothetical protein